MAQEITPNINDLFAKVSGSLNELDDLEQNYQENKERIVRELADQVDSLAKESLSQAVRAQVVRRLYWEQRLPSNLIGAAFGLSPGRLRKLAGSKNFEFQCDNIAVCGNSIIRAFRSRSDYQSHLNHRRKLKQRTDWFRELCSTCEEARKLEQEKAEIARQQEKAKQMAALQQRNQELSEMSWDDYTETPEWIKTRNRAVENSDYKCEICQQSPRHLSVYLQKDTPQDNALSVFNDVYKYYVLCRECVPRCEGLLDEGKGDEIKREFFDSIREWMFENDREYNAYRW